MRELKFRIFDGDRMRYPIKIQNFSYTIPTEETNPQYDEECEKVIGIKYDILIDEYLYITDDKSILMEFNCKNKPQIKATMQYTGLKDKNGVEIYEGDIVKFIGQYQAEQGKVCWYQTGGWGVGEYEIFLHELFEWKDPKEGGKFLDVEVIGNIYEDEDLLSK